MGALMVASLRRDAATGSFLAVTGTADAATGAIVALIPARSLEVVVRIVKIGDARTFRPVAAGLITMRRTTQAPRHRFARTTKTFTGPMNELPNVPIRCSHSGDPPARQR